MNLEDKSNEELMDIIKNNGQFEGASRVLYNRNKWLVLGIVGKARNPDDVQDLIQDVFLKVYLNLNKYNKKHKFTTWIGRIAVNEIMYYFGKKRLPVVIYDEFHLRMNRRELGNPVAEVETPDNILIRKEERELVREKVNELSPGYRKAVTYKWLDERSYEQVAEMLGVREVAVRNRIRWARKSLKQKLSRYMNS
jgi:RNA polymerase sigma-70 factor (ECF subfamily)